MEEHVWTNVPQERMTALITRQAIHTANLTIARIQLLKGALVPLHHHVSEQVTTVESGSLACRMGGREIVLEAGHMLVIPPDLPHEVQALEDSFAIDVFAPRREDWIRGDDAYLRK
jgi:quercetin dioxygenase-like cupin family protein